jgi:hypothetical protein
MKCKSTKKTLKKAILCKTDQRARGGNTVLCLLFQIKWNVNKYKLFVLVWFNKETNNFFLGGRYNLANCVEFNGTGAS